MSSTCIDAADAARFDAPAALDAAGDAYLRADGTGRVLGHNTAATALFDRGGHDLVGADLAELLASPEARGEPAVGAVLWPVAGDLVEVTIRRCGAEAHLEVSAWETGADGERNVHVLCRDVTDRVRQHRDLADLARRLTEAQALAGMGSWEWDLATDAVVWSPELYRILGVPEGTQVDYASFIERLHPDDRPKVQAVHDARSRDGHELHYEARIVRADGQIRWIATHGEATADGSGATVRLRGTAHDITDRKLAELELQRLAVTDALTGLATRARFDSRLEAALDDSARSAEPVALLLLDLDRFKPVNDTHGHPVGDEVLIELARRFGRCTRPSDTLARLGGDEFALVLPGADDADATRIAARLVDIASEPIDLADGRSITVGASVGIAVSSPPPRGAGELRRRADQALYTAKRNGRGRHVTFTSQLVPTGSDAVRVRTRDARAWADYMVALRADIAARMEDGLMPSAARAPTSVLRTLELMLAFIDHLPDTEEARLPMPERVQLEEFVFHQSMVHDWADALVDRGILTTRRPADAVAFWSDLCEATATTA